MPNGKEISIVDANYYISKFNLSGGKANFFNALGTSNAFLVDKELVKNHVTGQYVIICLALGENDQPTLVVADCNIKIDAGFHPVFTVVSENTAAIEHVPNGLVTELKAPPNVETATLSFTQSIQLNNA